MQIFALAAAAAVAVAGVEVEEGLEEAFGAGRGLRLSPSASAEFFPGRYFRVKLYSLNSLTQRIPVALSLADVITYVSGLLSVYTVKEAP